MSNQFLYRVSRYFLFVALFTGANTYAQQVPLDETGVDVRLYQELIQSKTSSIQLNTLESSLPILSAESVGSLPARMTLSEIQSVREGGIADFNIFRNIRNSKIVGGVNAGQNEVPWQVALVLSGYPASSGQFCGGSILDDSWILTAAHCVDNMNPRQLQIYSGSVVLSGLSGNVTSVERIVVHPRWNSRTMENDIALIKLNSKLQFLLDKVAPVKLPSDNDVTAPGSILTVTGWGAISEGGPSSRSLKKVNVPMISFVECNAPDFYSGEVLAGMLCAGIGGLDSCQGDSGGPLVKGLNGNQTVQLGVVSWGYGCARPNKPGVYTELLKFIDWIASSTRA